MHYPYNGKDPEIDITAYVAENAVITGDVTVGARVSIWYHTVIRGDVEPTVIGDDSNIQDQSLLHQSPNLPLVIGRGVTVGHQCMLHSCTIHDGALIGMGSTILDGAVIGENAFIGAGSLVTPNTEIPPGKLALGRPARVVRDLTEDDYAELTRIRQTYVDKGKVYKRMQEER
ncbi:gamma carbonic anhydrase family protein [Alkalicoccus urumqiensis]|uniref:Gamma carbonic anhydrase family protein n=1 Tax=Alkalicoccus urumqiensis TaxID=1548213 RepID=A0A2P6MGT7_ALKUR|nr:gamma carbonic anhydrase family protein [Alkalicoccus urumqiensis]PRO65499.1 gamma carbonic anhydrase family protein [Alkalicoccus urumqiensis]